MNSAMQNGASVKKVENAKLRTVGARRTPGHLTPLANWTKEVSQKKCTRSSIY
jgi:hypothetical protein